MNRSYEITPQRIVSHEVFYVRKRQRISLSAASIFLILIDPKTAIESAQSGLLLCIHTIVPTLFPLFFLSAILTDSIADLRLCRFNGLCKFMGLPIGAESSFLLSLVGGYPVGTKTVHSLYNKGYIDISVANRLMGFYNLAGPSFIFGFSATLFEFSYAPWLVWGIQILSAITVALILPHKKTVCSGNIHANVMQSIPQILGVSIKNIAMVCGWIVLFRIVIGYADTYILHYISNGASVLITGFLELSNGTTALTSINNEALRFVLFNVFLSFGGLCVIMQIISAGQGIISHAFFIGKGLHFLITLSLSLVIQRILRIPGYDSIPFLPILISVFIVILISAMTYSKKRVATEQYLLYNVINNR